MSKLDQLKETDNYKDAWEAAQEWLCHDATNENILHVWEDFTTFYFVVKVLDEIVFLRVFHLGNKYVVSQDEEYLLSSLVEV